MSAASAPILLVFGAGSNVGLKTAAHFANRGYRVAVVSRKLSAAENPKYLTINADVGDPGAIQGVFERVRAELGDPNVVLWNRMLTYPPPPFSFLFLFSFSPLLALPPPSLFGNSARNASQSNSAACRSLFADERNQVPY